LGFLGPRREFMKSMTRARNPKTRKESASSIRGPSKPLRLYRNTGEFSTTPL
jgi:hypothetical protein